MSKGRLEFRGMPPHNATVNSGKAATKGNGNNPTCLARALADVIGTEPKLEAVTLSPEAKALSLATMGAADSAQLEQQVEQAILTGSKSGQTTGCGLLAGTNDCATCPNPLDAARRSQINVTRTGEGTTFSRITCPTAPKFWHWMRFPLPRFVQRELALPADHDHANDWKQQLLAAVICGGLGLAAYFTPLETASLALYIAAYVAGAWFTVGETWERLRKRTVDVHFLMLAVAAGSASIGAWGEGAMLLFLFSISGALEHYALGRTQREIASLFKEAPKTATVIDASGKEHEQPVAQLAGGMVLAIKPNSQFPVDAQITKGSTAADESTLSGESAPVDKRPGDTVLAGTLNLWGAVQARVLRPATESALQKIIHLIREAQRSKAPSQRFTDRFGSGYTVIVLGLTVVMFFVWWRGYGLAPFVSTAESASAFYQAMTLLVVASPCALVLSIPSAILAAIAWAAKRGILFRGGAAVEMLAEVNVVALDKTGTLTTGQLSVESLRAVPAQLESEAREIAWSLARHSTHPLSRALTEHGRHLGWQAREIDHLESVAGQGVSGRINESLCLLGRREFIESMASGPTRELLKQLPRESTSRLPQPEVWLATERLVAHIQFHDELRPEAGELITALRAAGLQTVLLTGDRLENAEAIQRELQLDEVRAELRPDDKLAYIVKQRETGGRVAMIGDGVNDAPSLAAAHVGVAMGVRGSDAALEQADVVLMRDRLENFLAAYQLSQRARRIIQQNLFISLGTVLLLVGFALAGQIPLTLGVLGHEGSTVIVVLNSLRLLFLKPPITGVSS